LEEAVTVREFGEDILEVEVNGIEGFCAGRGYANAEGLEAQGGEVFNPQQEFHAFGFEGAEFVTEFLEAVVGFFVSFEGEHVDGFHPFHPFLEQADLGLEGGEIFVGLGFGGEFWEFGGEFGALGGDLNDQVVDFGLALLLELGEFAIECRSADI
jgi:hypothetical protein